MGEKIWQAVTTNIGTKVISVIIAIVLWFIVLGSRNVEVVKEIPLEVITPAELVPSNEIPDRISFRLGGPKAFLRAVLDRREEPIRVNLSGAKSGLVTYRFFSDNIRVPIGVKVLSINPAAILIKLEHMKEREIPIRVELKGVPPEGYKIATVSVKPEMIRIKGAESRVDGVTELSTVPIDVSGLKQDFQKEVPLELSRSGVQIDGPLPIVNLGMEAVSANYRIKNVDVHILSAYRTRLAEKTVAVLVRASPADLRQLDRSHVYAVVDLSGKRKGKYNAAVKVTLPENIGMVKVIPDHVNVTLY